MYRVMATLFPHSRLQLRGTHLFGGIVDDKTISANINCASHDYDALLADLNNLAFIVKYGPLPLNRCRTPELRWETYVIARQEGACDTSSPFYLPLVSLQP